MVVINNVINNPFNRIVDCTTKCPYQWEYPD
jgi:hypothetical protein